MGLVGCCLHIWHQVEVPFLMSPSGSWVMGAGGRVILICLLRYQWAHRPVSTACMFTNLLVYNKSITEWLGVGIIKDRSHNLCNTSFSKSTQINAQRTSEQHACCKKLVLKKRKKKVVLQVLQLLKQSEHHPSTLSTQKSGATTQNSHLQTVEGMQFRGRNGVDWYGPDLKFQQVGRASKEAVMALLKQTFSMSRSSANQAAGGCTQCIWENMAGNELHTLSVTLKYVWKLLPQGANLHWREIHLGGVIFFHQSISPYIRPGNELQMTSTFL